MPNTKYFEFFTVFLHQLKPGSILANKKIHVVPKSVVDNLNLASTQIITNNNNYNYKQQQAIAKTKIPKSLVDNIILAKRQTITPCAKR